VRTGDGGSCRIRWDGSVWKGRKLSDATCDVSDTLCAVDAIAAHVQSAVPMSSP
jgi:cob(I)alamin adenosyltransferase